MNSHNTQNHIFNDGLFEHFYFNSIVDLQAILRSILHSYTLIFCRKSLFLNSSEGECPSTNLEALGSNPGRGHLRMSFQKILPCRILIFSYFECLGCLLWGLKGHSRGRLYFIKIRFGVLWNRKKFFPRLFSARSSSK